MIDKDLGGGTTLVPACSASVLLARAVTSIAATAATFRRALVLLILRCLVPLQLKVAASYRVQIHSLAHFAGVEGRLGSLHVVLVG